MTRGEFDPGREADALTAEPPRTARRVRPNAASEHAVRLEAAIAARDSAMFPALIAEDGVAIDHRRALRTTARHHSRT